MDCLFCKIAKKEINSEMVFENQNVFAFLDINPRSPGHVMVIPKKHAEKITQLSQVELGEFFNGVNEVIKKIEKALKPDGFTLGINQGQAAGQVIEHLHFHIMPRWHSDGGGSIHSAVNNKPKESLKEIQEKILKS